MVMIQMDNEKSDRILVVGGAGYIGGAVTDILLQKNVDFMVYDNLTFERDFRKPVNFVFGDILNTEKLLNIINSYNPTAIIWLAALVGDGACKVNPDLTLKLNQESVKWLSENYNGRIVFTSTCSVYGQGKDLMNEDSGKNPLSLYAVTKLKAEDYLKNKNAVIFRLGTLFGVSDNFSRIRFDLVVNILSLKAMRAEPLIVYGGDQWRPLLHVKDAAKAIVNAAMKTDEEKTISPGIYNIAYRNMTIKEIAAEISDAYIGDDKPEIRYLDVSFEDERNYRADCARYNSMKGAEKFLLTVKEGAKEIMELVKMGRIKDPLNPNYDNARYIRENFSKN